VCRRGQVGRRAALAGVGQRCAEELRVELAVTRARVAQQQHRIDKLIADLLACVPDAVLAKTVKEATRRGIPIEERTVAWGERRAGGPFCWGASDSRLSLPSLHG
jgi:hypothetical protein